MIYFFALFLPLAEGGYAVSFPDFPDISAGGVDFEDCIAVATSALSAAAADYAARCQLLPLPSTLAAVKRLADEKMRDPRMDNRASHGRGPLWQLIPTQVTGEAVVFVSICLPRSLLARIDEHAKASGLSRSDVLACAARILTN